MQNEIIKYIFSQGIFCALFVYILNYVLQTTKTREEKLQEIISKNQCIIADLSNKFDVVEDIKTDVEIIKEKIK